MDITIGMLVFPGMQLLDFAGPLDVFDATPGFRPLLVGSGAEPFALRGGMRIAPEAGFDDAPHLDVLFVPGGTGIRGAIENSETLRFLAERGAAASYVTSVCTGSLVLGAAGLLRGYRAATHWRFLDLLALVGAEPVAERIVHDRNRITGGGVTAGIDFALALVAELRGEGLAQRMQLALEYDPRPPFQAGNPATAPAPVVKDVRAVTQRLYDEREALLRSLPRAG
jgi:cyclohexyl-isocyanide hydratase